MPRNQTKAMFALGSRSDSDYNVYSVKPNSIGLDPVRIVIPKRVNPHIAASVLLSLLLHPWLSSSRRRRIYTETRSNNRNLNPVVSSREQGRSGSHSIAIETTSGRALGGSRFDLDCNCGHINVVQDRCGSDLDNFAGANAP